MIVLGFSVGHDKGAALIKDGEVLIAITQERLSRVKNDGAYLRWYYSFGFNLILFE